MQLKKGIYGPFLFVRTWTKWFTRGIASRAALLFRRSARHRQRVAVQVMIYFEVMISWVFLSQQGILSWLYAHTIELM